ncbi:hypothetical protein AB2B38_006355 [Balneola sp. MJW-20]|uniref:hypothetical protein n=1 Tax=Gracilimonas aurantiaca TaxID=3234185 RepID=UPI003466C812
MKVRTYTTWLLFLLGFVIYSCSNVTNSPKNDDLSDPLAVQNSNDVINPIVTGNDFTIGNYIIKFTGKTYDANKDESTFNYNVRGTGVEPALNYLFIETPPCSGAPVSYKPRQSAKVLDNGIKWESSVSSNSSADYSITYSGDQLVGLVDAEVTSGNDLYTAEIPGPCEGIYYIRGSVFVDGDESGARSGTEIGLPNVTVTLLTAGGEAYDQVTVVGGYYEFLVYTGSNSVDFTLEVRSETPDNATDFNEGLNESYQSTNLSSRTITVNQADVSDVDFGYIPQTEKLLQQFADGTIELNTKDPKYWLQQVRFSKRNNKNGDYSRREMIQILENIEDIYLDEPFQFGNDKIDAALEVLDKPVKTVLDELLIQLLTAELNVVTGRGTNSVDFNFALLAYGEEAAVQASSAANAPNQVQGSVEPPIASASSTDDFISQATSLLSSFNSSGGGGGVGGN